jgi:DNA-binding transcriptional LysR family regulator
MKDLDWNLARAFCATADAGSLSAAARKLGLTQPTLSRQVAALEAALAVTLFERIGKRLAITEAGLGLIEHARAMAAAADAMALAATGRAQDVSGEVCISATDAVAAYVLPEIVDRIRMTAPQIKILVVSSNALSDLRRREADIAIRHVRPMEPELIGRLITETTAHFYAAKSWVKRHGKPATIAELACADLLAFEDAERFSGHLTAAGIPLPVECFRVTSENSVVIWEMVRRGLGVGMMLREIAERTPDVVRLLPDLPGIKAPIWLVTHRELRTSLRVRLVFDMLAEGLGPRK